MSVATTRRLPAAVTAGLLAATLAACGSGSGARNASDSRGLAPQDAFAKAVTALQDGAALDLKGHLAVSDADLQAIAQKGGGTLSASQARYVTSGDVEIISRTTDGSKLSAAKPGAQAGSLVVHTDGSAIIELRVIGNLLFARADVKKIGELGGTAASRIDSQLQSVPPQLPFLKDAAAGKWLKIDAKQAGDLAKTYGGGAIPSADPQAAARARDQLLADLNRDVKATRAPDTDRGDHLVLTGSSKALVADLTKAGASVIPGGSQTLHPNSVTDKPVTLDAYVKDGKLALLSIELSQFAQDKALAKFDGKKLPLELAFSSAAPAVDAPAGAVTVDLSSLAQQLGSGLSAGPTPAPAATS